MTNMIFRLALNSPEVSIPESEFYRAKTLATRWVNDMGQDEALDLARRQCSSDFWRAVVYIIERDNIIRPLPPKPLHVVAIPPKQATLDEVRP